MTLHLPARLPCWRKHEMRLFADVGMEHGPLVLAIPTSTSVVRKLKKLWMLLLWLLQNPDGVMKLFTSKVVNDLPWILLWQGGWSVFLEQFFGCHLYKRPFLLSHVVTAPFSKTKTNERKNSHLMFNVCSSKLMDVFNSKHLRLNFYQSAEYPGIFFSSQRSISYTRDPGLYSKIEYAACYLSPVFFWLGLLNYYFVWMHSKVNWSLLITVYISLLNGLQKSTLKWRLESTELCTQIVLARQL